VLRGGSEDRYGASGSLRCTASCRSQLLIALCSPLRSASRSHQVSAPAPAAPKPAQTSARTRTLGGGITVRPRACLANPRSSASATTRTRTSTTSSHAVMYHRRNVSSRVVVAVPSECSLQSGTSVALSDEVGTIHMHTI
jgi:hypothetical protein